MWKLLLLLVPTTLVSQIDISTGYGDGYFNEAVFGETMVETRWSIKLKEKELYLTPSIGFVSDGVSYQTFPRIGVTKYLRTSNGNYNRITLGTQVWDLYLPDRYRNSTTWTKFKNLSCKTNLFLKFNTPIFKLFKNRNNGSQSNNLIGELIVDISTQTSIIGIGIRKRI